MQGRSSSLIKDTGFAEVPIDVMIMSADAWRVVWSMHWKYEVSILNAEARGLVRAVEHLLRENRFISRRSLCLSNNLPSVGPQCYQGPWSFTTSACSAQETRCSWHRNWFKGSCSLHPFRGECSRCPIACALAVESKKARTPAKPLLPRAAPALKGWNFWQPLLDSGFPFLSKAWGRSSGSSWR